MNSASQGTDGVLPPFQPGGSTSKLTKWTVLVLVLVVCGTPSALFYWAHQYYRIYSIPAESMEPTIRHGDQILVDMYYFHDHKPARGDVVVIQRPTILVIKRVIGLPGDTIEGREGTVLVNGTAVSEPYAFYSASEPLESSRNFGPTHLNAGEYFVLGDNRDNSLDSRYPEFGPVPLTTIVGRPLYILSSQKRGRAFERIK
jgi:signal peptidase I